MIASVGEKTSGCPSNERVEDGHRRVLAVVADTNCVLDLFHFADPDCFRLHTELTDGRVRLISNRCCLEELRRVLGRDCFALGDEAQRLVVERYAGFCSFVDGDPQARIGIPRCRDVDDQKFVDLAVQARVDFLLSRDKAVLSLARRLRRWGIEVMTPAQMASSRWPAVL